MVACNAIPEAATLTATDNCSTATVAYSQAISNVVCAGTYKITRTWTATDECGNGVTVTQDINVVDNIDPTFNEATPVEVFVSCDAVPTAAVLTASDSCGTATVVMIETTTPGICPSTYTIVRTWTATDLCDNDISVSQTINVSDSVGPFIIGDLDNKVQVTCDNIPPKPELTFGDNCSTINEPVYDEEIGAVVLGIYTITRTWIVTDACGNFSTFTQYVTVTQTTDVTVVNDVQRCNDSNNAQVDLVSLLPQGTESGGTWNFGTLTGVNGTVLSPLGVTEGTYTVSYLITSGTCPRRIDINVNIIFCQVLPCIDVVVHNAFTPNNDAQNLNEYFNIENIEQDCHLPNTVEIYNRWGVLVYEAENYDNNTTKFIGISEGRSTVDKSAELPTGTYFYIIKYSTASGTKVDKNGYLYLTR